MNLVSLAKFWINTGIPSILFIPRLIFVVSVRKENSVGISEILFLKRIT
jgi:hypothetical protein